MNHRIDVDDDVYAVLEQNAQGFEHPNDVLRRLLLPPESRSPRSNRIESIVSPTSVRGRLADLIKAGLIKPGDELRHEQKRRGRVFVATVEPNGQIRTPKGLYSFPSPALGTLVGTQIDGWHHFTHVPSGRTLRELRRTLDK